jgi:hypothetical protein
MGGVRVHSGPGVPAGGLEGWLAVAGGGVKEQNA